jgi:hypothetical protein
MSLPTFVGIGVPRAGTTWLHELLRSHPEIYVPSRRRELNYFDLYYHRGLSWYEKFFPPDSRAWNYRAIGEITPYYFYDPHCPARMAELPVQKLLLMLRNPVDRAWSWYALMVRDGHYQGTFESFLTQTRWPVVQQGTYSTYLENYLRYFERDRLLILVLEEVVRDVPETKRRLATFLGVACDRFPDAAGTAVANESYVPSAGRAYGLAVRAARLLRRWDADWLVNTAKRLGVKSYFGNAGRAEPMAEETRARLHDAFAKETEKLERLLGISLKSWRSAGSQA